MKSFTIYHNPKCSKSRQALALLREAGVELTVVEYLKTPLSVAQLSALARKLALPVHAMLRDGEDEYAALDLGAPGKTDAEVLAAIAQHPILLQRPIIEQGPRAVIGRPPEKLKELL
jgi:arsenate reductase